MAPVNTFHVIDDASFLASLPDNVNEFKQLLIAREEQLTQREQAITEHQNTIAALTKQRDE